MAVLIVSIRLGLRSTRFVFPLVIAARLYHRQGLVYFVSLAATLVPPACFLPSLIRPCFKRVGTLNLHVGVLSALSYGLADRQNALISMKSFILSDDPFRRKLLCPAFFLKKKKEAASMR